MNSRIYPNAGRVGMGKDGLLWLCIDGEGRFCQQAVKPFNAAMAKYRDAPEEKMGNKNKYLFKHVEIYL